MRAGRILVVDDDRRILKAVCQTLREAGYEVHSASNPSRAAALAARVRPRLAILDVCMPRMNGFELADALRARRSTAHVLCMFLTAQETSAHIEEAREVRACAYLQKPFRREALLAAVARVLEPEPV